MNYSNFLKILPITFLMMPAGLHADAEPKKSPTLEEMSAAELKEALKKSHAEIESRLGSRRPEKASGESEPVRKKELSSLPEKRTYESSAQRQIDALDYKIQALEHSINKDRGAALDDAYRLRSIKSKARDQLAKIKADNSDGWRTGKQVLDSLLRDAARY